jgi:hypothetical protein
MLKFSMTDRLCIAGLPGTGKTIFMRYLLSFADPDIYILDPLNQYQEFGAVGDVMDGKSKRAIPLQESPQELEIIAKKFYSLSNRVLAIEEAEQFIPQDRPLLPYTSGLVRMGRNWGIGIWGTTRRIQDINKRFFDLAQRVFFFRCGLKSREYIADLIGLEYMYPVPVPKYNKTGYSITTLPPYHCLHFDLELETAEVICLQIGARTHLETVGKKSEAPKAVVKAIAEQEPDKGPKPWKPAKEAAGDADKNTALPGK